MHDDLNNNRPSGHTAGKTPAASPAPKPFLQAPPAVPSAKLSAAMFFLDSIGLKPQLSSGVRGFIRKVRIEHGKLLVDPKCPVSALLHEAGHLAILPAQYRHLAGPNVDKAVSVMLEEISTLDEHPDSPLYRAAKQASDPEATAWAWAAGLELGLPAAEIIRDREYERSGASIRIGLQLRRWPGINGLVHAGMCLTPRAGSGYPAMLLWAQPRIAPQPGSLHLW